MTQTKTMPDSKDVRKFVFDYFEQHASTPVLEQIMRRFELSRSTAFKMVTELESARHIVLVPGTQRILMAWPFSSVATPFKVTLTNGRKEYFANCAWDAVAFHVMLRNEQQIDSYCHHCAQEIRIHLKDQRKESSSPEDPLVYLALPAAKWWENILLTCSNNMTFFSSHGHLEEWKKSNFVMGGEALTIDQTLKLSIPFYRDKMSVDYARPSRDQIMQHFKSLGLPGDFWKI